MIGYNYKNLKIIANDQKDLLKSQDLVIDNLDTLTKKLKNKVTNNIGYLRIFNKPYNYLIFFKQDEHILIFRYNEQKNKLYDNIDIKDITLLFQSSKYIDMVVGTMTKNNKISLLMDSVLIKMKNYSTHFYNTLDFKDKREEDFEIKDDGVEL